MTTIPLRLHRKIEQKYPKAWRLYADFIDMKGSPDLADWPSWCYMPMAAAYGVVSGGGALTPERAKDIAKVAALAAWRPYRAVVDLRQTPLDEMLKAELPANPEPGHFDLPVWCPFVQVTHEEGLFLHLEHDINGGHAEFRGLYVTDKLECMPIVMDLRGTLQEGARSVVQEAFRVSQSRGGYLPLEMGVTDRIAKAVEPAMTIAVYLREQKWTPQVESPRRRTADAASSDQLYTV